ncbi:indole-3-glycerol phosphate synthase TrpC [Carboxylicivirga sp. M1479]|uniref:indole-3-glycerol phosphate synthase TrpC n=1 Tax=Carboxylicivirga sp. M1479 TaxID=2594476 RepID=UPI0011784492|nr:indole-3-glycerol phosphate synthase TrpC [Carboxylicivirga sp. M1479]TRX72328.1 indole-3-glycerol phosphate synthase TrpC [Carboxylicivirga sp. M1479]
MNILNKIVDQKKIEVENAKKTRPIEQLMDIPMFFEAVPSLKNSISCHSKTGVITEFKRQSPSKGLINGTAKVEEVVKGYEEVGSSALSVLTDTQFFGGCNDDLSAARKVTSIPILRKDFIIDPYQVYEAKAIGASAILLIAAILEENQAKELGALANYLGMEVLMELHEPDEASRLNAFVDVVGINNRNLKTFKVDLKQSIALAKSLPSDKLKISESGIHSPKDVHFLRRHGFDGFLIGENFMKTDNPGKAFADFAKEIKVKEKV